MVGGVVLPLPEARSDICNPPDWLACFPASSDNNERRRRSGVLRLLARCLLLQESVDRTLNLFPVGEHCCELLGELG